jgi:exopolyphosphatase/guanosine-5'-triphosphate,3'-diphosphate pyrophosphatase
VDESDELSESTMARTMEALRDFRALAIGAGAKRIVAVATAAMRDAANGALFAERVRRELGIDIEIIEGRDEARYGFAGAVMGLEVSNGMLFDLGGGSLQIARFSERRLDRSTSLPVGALRLSEQFLPSDPPTRKQMRRLRDHVRAQLKKARMGYLRFGERLVGTGGTLRNLAKIDRDARRYPVGILHGYVLTRDRLVEVVDQLASMRQKRRDEVHGLSAERADSIVGGAVAIQTLVEYVRASEILVSGQGVREGVALRLLKMPVGSPDEIKDASLASLGLRFDSWSPEASLRRRSVAAVLHRSLEPRPQPHIAEALDHAARILDIGRSVDVVKRHEHTADMVLSAELHGFSHEDIALVSGIVRRAGDRHADDRPLSALVGAPDLARLDRAAVILALADEIEARCRHGVPIALTCRIDRRVTLSVPLLPAWRPKDLDRRFERAFGRPLVVRGGSARRS